MIYDKYQSRVSIGTRLGAVCGIVILYTAIIALMAASQQKRLHETLQRHDAQAIPTAQLTQVLSGMEALRGHEVRLVAAEPGEQAELQNMLASDRAQVESSLRQYQAVSSGEQTGVIYEQVASRVQAYLRAHDQVVALVGNGRRDAAIKALAEAQRTLETSGPGAVEWATQNKAVAAKTLNEGDGIYHHGLKLLMAMACFTLLSAAWSATRMIRSITQPLRRATEQAKRVARGDLTQTLQVRGNDELCDLFEALNDMTSRLSRLIADVVHSAAAVDGTAMVLSQNNLELSQRTQQQAAHLRQTSASVAHITEIGKSNSDNAANADRLGTEARKLAESGGEVVTQAITAMSDINRGSARIANIIGLIDEIAFQTNLLALNAAVEAARAGDQGRGFAVVASEVRALAQRSADAAKQIKTLITESAQSVRVGSELVDRTGSALLQIRGSVRDMTDLIKQIASSSHQQAIDAQRINQAMLQIDHATEQYAHSVEQGTSAAGTLRDQAGALSQRASYFTLRTSAAAADARSERRASPERETQTSEPEWRKVG